MRNLIRIELVLTLCVLMGSCTPISMQVMWIDSLKHGEVRVKGFMGSPPPRNCSRWQHDSPTSDHNEWARCMGVEYK